MFLCYATTVFHPTTAADVTSHTARKRRSWLVKPPMPLRFRTFEPALQ